LYALQDLAPECSLAGNLLTHAHIGHYTGLVNPGREVMDAKAVPVYSTERMASFLRNNEPWSSLLDNGNIDVRIIVPDVSVKMGSTLRITPIKVPHRDELSDTVGYIIEGPSRKLLYCPDIDSWDAWDRDIREVASAVDVALLDGTFYSEDELPGRDISEIQHPLATETGDRLSGVDCDVRLVHLNHSNPLLSPDRGDLLPDGIETGTDSDRFTL
jgi:pyrroloquinoline quinone biosynthesis protein B